MRFNNITRYLALTLLLFLPCHQGLAQEQPQIGELTYLDRQYMSQQRALLTELASRNFGRRFNGQRDNDLELLQRLLDDRLVRPEQVQELQAMGIIMGDLLAAELDLRWVVYQDKLGRSRALADDVTGTYLFPVTMISRRREADNQTPVKAIYTRARETVVKNRPALPFH